MDAREELRQIRQRIADLDARLDRLTGLVETGTPAVLVQVVAEASLPTAARSFFAVVAVDPSGIEREGTIPTLTPRTQIRYAANVGASPPPAGTFLVADQLDRYLVINYG